MLAATDGRALYMQDACTLRRPVTLECAQCGAKRFWQPESLNDLANS